MTKYRTANRCGIAQTVLIGDALDRAPRPYTAQELAEVTGCDGYTILAFLNANTYAEHISCREVARDRPHETGKPLREYWRGDRTVWFTFGEGVEKMDEKIGKSLTEGKRPVSWKDGTRTVWSIDETETVSAMRGNNVVRMGKAQEIKALRTGYSIRIEGGPVLRFRKEATQ